MNALPSHWIKPEWPAPARVRSCITTRPGGVSRGPFASFNLGSHVGDDPAAVTQNRSQLRRCLPDEPFWLRQVHGTRVVDADQGQLEPEADAAFTRASGRVLAALTADCLPILLCHDAGTVAAVAHAGWRGLAAGVIENAVLAAGASPERMMAYIGPAIGADVYEVGPEVRAAFVDQTADAALAFRPHGAGKFLADLALLARQRLARAGVRRVFGGEHCTYSEPERFFSFRRDGVTGRMASLIWLE